MSDDTVYPQAPREDIPEKKARKSKGWLTSILLVAVCLLAGFGGGTISGFLLAQSEHRPAVTIQETPPPLSPAPQQAYHSIAEQVAAKVADSVVEITTESKQTHPFYGSYITGGAGSGVILAEDGYIVTNNHVIDGATSIKVRLHTGEEHFATLIGTDIQTDLSVIRIDVSGLRPVVIADSDSIVVGQPVVAVGNPLGTLGGTVTEGIISAKDREIVIGGESMTLLQTSAAINPGNSGGALFDEDGQLVGVVNAKSSGEEIEGIGFAIPANTVKTIVPDLIENGYITGRPMLGAGLIDVDSLEKMMYYRLEQPGVYVASIDGKSSLEQWDRIVAVGGQEVVNADEVKRLVHQHQAGDALDIAVIRQGKEQSLTVTLMEAAPETASKA